MILLGVAREGSPLLPDGWPRDDHAQSLPGRSFHARVDVRGVPFTAYNVVGVVRGSDPARRNTYIAYGAHYDHIGIMLPVRGDSIANGADDDGSGSVALLAIARRMMAAHPRRSVLFVWHVGEEKGLLGSAYFTSHPTVPIDSIVAQINADMIGRNAPDSLYLVGPRAAPNGKSRILGVIVDSVNAALPRPFAINRGWDAADTPDEVYQRSDHFNYARHGIPIVFFSSGLHGDYHDVGDEPAKIDYVKLARVTQLLYETGRAVADRPDRPD
jgi:Zn-dependent M28 family amino/carboxypeptidase